MLEKQVWPPQLVKLLRVEQRATMRLWIIAGVVVKPHFAVAEGADRFAVLDDVGDEHEGRIEIAPGAVAMQRLPAHRDLAEDFGGAQLIFLAEVLVSENEHDMLAERTVDGPCDFIADRPGQIDAADFRAGMGMDFLDRQHRLCKRHGVSPCSVIFTCIHHPKRLRKTGLRCAARHIVICRSACSVSGSRRWMLACLSIAAHF